MTRISLLRYFCKDISCFAISRPCSAITIRDYSSSQSNTSISSAKGKCRFDSVKCVDDAVSLFRRMNGLVEKAMSLFHKLEIQRDDTDIEFYSVVINGLCKNGQLDKARATFQKLSLIGLFPDVITYNTIINGFCLEGLLDEAKNMLMKMEENGCSPDNATYNIIVRGFLKFGKTSEMTIFLKEMAGRHFSFDASTVELLIDVIAKNPSLFNMIPQFHSGNKK